MFIQQKDQILRGCISFAHIKKCHFVQFRQIMEVEESAFFRTFIHFVPFSIQDTNEAIVIADIIGSLAREESATKINAFAALLETFGPQTCKNFKRNC